MSPHRVLVMLGSLWLAACAAFPRLPPATSPTDQRILAAERELSRAEAELHQQKAATSVDCPRACDLTATICQLAERICTLAQQNPADNLHPRCQDARQRCQRARQDTAASCNCEDPRQRPARGE